MPSGNSGEAMEASRELQTCEARRPLERVEGKGVVSWKMLLTGYNEACLWLTQLQTRDGRSVIEQWVGILYSGTILDTHERIPVLFFKVSLNGFMKAAWSFWNASAAGKRTMSMREADPRFADMFQVAVSEGQWEWWNSAAEIRL